MVCKKRNGKLKKLRGKFFKLNGNGAKQKRNIKNVDTKDNIKKFRVKPKSAK